MRQQICTVGEKRGCEVPLSVLSMRSVFIEITKSRPDFFCKISSPHHANFDVVFGCDSSFSADFLSSSGSKAVKPVIKALVTVIVPMELVSHASRKIGSGVDRIMLLFGCEENVDGVGPRCIGNTVHPIQ